MADKKRIEEDNIANIDKNLEVKTTLGVDDVVFYDTKKAPFKLYGACKEELDVFKRMPENIAETVSNGVKSLNFNTPGIRVRFMTDSDYVAIKAVMPSLRRMSHMALTGSSGFDMYLIENGTYRYIKTFVPPQDAEQGYESIAYFGGKKNRCLEINFPLYSRVDELYVGIRTGASVYECDGYKYDKPVLYYGSSITQGGCASKPGNSYQSIISHELDCDYINLGFSGNAKGEKEIAEYVADVDCSVFVCDYDYNAPTVDYLRETHLELYKIYRAKNPDTPIIFVSAPTVDAGNKNKIDRKQVILDTYNYAISNGDNNVSFVDGMEMFGGKYGNVYTVDGTHPNDAGFLRMAEYIGGAVEKALKA